MYICISYSPLSCSEGHLAMPLKIFSSGMPWLNYRYFYFPHIKTENTSPRLRTYKMWAYHLYTLFIRFISSTCDGIHNSFVPPKFSINPYPSICIVNSHQTINISLRMRRDVSSAVRLLKFQLIHKHLSAE